MRKFGDRKNPRCKGYDYTLPGTYFVTTVAHGRTPLFGVLRGGTCGLSAAGRAVDATWRRIPERFPGVELDTFVVMPDHVHALLVVCERHGSDAVSLSAIIQWAKSRSAHQINVARRTPGKSVWQVSFHDRIVRNDLARARIRRYIENNPRQ